MLTRLDVITPPAGQVVSLATVKQMARVDDDADDSVISSFIDMATDLAQQYLNRALLTQTLQWTVGRSIIAQGIPVVTLPFSLVMPPWYPWSYFGNQWSIELPRNPVQQVVSVSQGFWGQYPDTFLATSDYNLDLASTPARLQVLAGATSFPDHLTVQYKAGWDMVNTIVTLGIATQSATISLTVAGQSYSIPVAVGATPLAISTAIQAALAAFGAPSGSVLTPSMVQLRGANVAASVTGVPAGLTVTVGTPASEIPAAVVTAITLGAVYLYQNLADPQTTMPSFFYRGLDPYRLITFA